MGAEREGERGTREELREIERLRLRPRTSSATTEVAPERVRETRANERACVCVLEPLDLRRDREREEGPTG